MVNRLISTTFPTLFCIIFISCASLMNAFAADMWDIIAGAHTVVSHQLKAPSTAKFPYALEEHKIVDLGDNKWKVASYVDSQNSFGAMIRTYYTVTIKCWGQACDEASLVSIDSWQ